MIPVHCTRARHVSKPRGANAGTVNVTHGSVLKVRPDIRLATRLRAEKKIDSPHSPDC